MAVRWSIPFKSLRSGTLYTVNIIDPSYSGSPVTLYGGANPFSTAEDDSEDVFSPVRTQSGYITIVDNGYAADGVTPFDWHAVIPEKATSRPVTLVAGNRVLWQGFIQSHNFESDLYEGIAERKFAVHCVLSVLGSHDVDVTRKGLTNFAGLVSEAMSWLDGIDGIDIGRYLVSGGTDALAWMQKRCDRQNFVSVDADGVLQPKYDMRTLMEDICQFWGWTLRTNGTDILFTMGDTASPSYLVISPIQLAALASGDASGISAQSYQPVTVNAAFVNTENVETVMMPVSRATVTADCGDGDSEVVKAFPDSVEDDMNSRGAEPWERYEGAQQRVTNSMTEFSTPFLTGTCATGRATFNMAAITNTETKSEETHSFIRLKDKYDGTVKASFSTVFHHCFSDNYRESGILPNLYLRLCGKVYWHGRHVTERSEGVGIMVVRIGIGETRLAAKWWDGATYGWSDEVKETRIYMGYTDGTLPYVVHGSTAEPTADIPTSITSLSGLLFVDFMGMEEFADFPGSYYYVDVADFALEFRIGYRNLRAVTKKDADTDTRMEYTARNQGNSRELWNADCIFASSNRSPFGYGVLVDPDGRRMSTASFGGTPMHPEQRLADRVASYWSSSKHRLHLELNAAVVAVSPERQATFNGVTYHPVGISHVWRDDILKLTLQQL